MLRIEFLKRISLTAILVAAVNVPEGKEPKKVSNGTKGLLEIPLYPMSVADEILLSITNKIFQSGMEFDSFLILFSSELKNLYPYDENAKTLTYKDLYCASIRCEILFCLANVILKVWQNLCLQFGFEGYGTKEFESDTIQIQEWIISLGNQFKMGGTPHFSLKTKEDQNGSQTKVNFFVPWFGNLKTETIQFFPLSLEIHKVWKEAAAFKNQIEFNQNIVSEVLRILNLLLYRMNGAQARWHQYSVRFYYLNFVEQEFEQKQNKKNQEIQNQNSKSLVSVRGVSLESAVRTIKERAFHMQSGVYHEMDRQNQQMVVSSLIHVMDQISESIDGEKEITKKLRLVHKYGGIISVSTAASARDSLSVIEDALFLLQKERRLHFP
ncbi:hypothetical protein CLV96_3657 [Leptospira meyeri]|uniref:Uncharacterized protein n=1 Tax=Leptospira meyeri TaxID=29508 RepID=A0A4R8MJM9_LEPME|nr:hypothetical protein [Leptospira meyeri]EKJ86361.1 hypothetical protein LEP1GSC017_1048 [Leptospira meyeri serovar Hardjo str. Went 5]TDY67236.1 hypothetical protein CLV96_3657 [Leptospira meyeri]